MSENAASLLPFDLDYFQRGRTENPTFWWRIGGQPDLRGKAVLDVGCGLGSLAVDMARAGAERVVGIDVEPRVIGFARENVRLNFPELAPVVEFRHVSITDLPDERFDAITAKDSFEHILDLPAVLAGMRDHLAPRGRLYAGCGPLYHSPFGDHGIFTKTRLPWLHVLVPEPLLLWHARAPSIAALGLNKLSPADFRRMFAESGLRVVSLRVNRSTNPVSRVFAWAGRIPPLEKYVTHNLYAVLERVD